MSQKIRWMSAALCGLTAMARLSFMIPSMRADSSLNGRQQ